MHAGKLNFRLVAKSTIHLCHSLFVAVDASYCMLVQMPLSLICGYASMYVILGHVQTRYTGTFIHNYKIYVVRTCVHTYADKHV